MIEALTGNALPTIALLMAIAIMDKNFSPCTRRSGRSNL